MDFLDLAELHSLRSGFEQTRQAQKQTTASLRKEAQERAAAAKAQQEETADLINVLADALEQLKNVTKRRAAAVAQQEEDLCQTLQQRERDLEEEHVNLMERFDEWLQGAETACAAKLGEVKREATANAIADLKTQAAPGLTANAARPDAPAASTALSGHPREKGAPPPFHHDERQLQVPPEVEIKACPPDLHPPAREYPGAIGMQETGAAGLQKVQPKNPPTQPKPPPASLLNGMNHSNGAPTKAAAPGFHLQPPPPKPAEDRGPPVREAPNGPSGGTSLAPTSTTAPATKKPPPTTVKNPPGMTPTKKPPIVKNAPGCTPLATSSPGSSLSAPVVRTAPTPPTHSAPLSNTPDDSDRSSCTVPSSNASLPSKADTSTIPVKAPPKGPKAPPAGYVKAGFTPK